MSMVSELFTHDELCILDIYVRRTRKEVIEKIESAIPEVDDPMLVDHCKSLAAKLSGMGDEDYNILDL